MPYQEFPDKIDDTIVVGLEEPTWVRCNQCGYRLLYAVEAVFAELILYCVKCKRTYRVFLGVDVETR